MKTARELVVENLIARDRPLESISPLKHVIGAAMPHRLFRLSEEVMGHRPFSKPVYLRLHETGNYVAWSAWEALEYLERYWDRPKAKHYRRARKLCQNAIDGWVSADKAREALVDAARRAGLLMAGKRTSRGNSNVVFRSIPQPEETRDTA